MPDVRRARLTNSKAASTLWGESQRLCLRPHTCGFRLARRAFRSVKNITSSGVFVAGGGYHTAKPPGLDRRPCLFPIRCRFRANIVWGSRTGVQAKRPDSTKKAYATRRRPQAAFWWRWNSNSKAVGTLWGAESASAHVGCAPLGFKLNDRLWLRG
jgi:hypothetical protein